MIFQFLRLLPEVLIIRSIAPSEGQVKPVPRQQIVRTLLITQPAEVKLRWLDVEEESVQQSVFLLSYGRWSNQQGVRNPKQLKDYPNLI